MPYFYHPFVTLTGCVEIWCVWEKDSEAGCQLAHITAMTCAELLHFNLNILFSYPKTLFPHDFEREKKSSSRQNIVFVWLKTFLYRGNTLPLGLCNECEGSSLNLNLNFKPEIGQSKKSSSP